MGETKTDPPGPDLRAGVPVASVAEGELFAGQVDGEPVLLVRTADGWFAIGASCTHYGVSLAGGLLVDGAVRCPAHHAAFDLATGAAVRAPALRPVPCWEVEVDGETVRVTRQRPAASPPRRAQRAGEPDSVVIVGAGAAGAAAAMELRARGYRGRVTLLGAERDAPYDRPNVSKDYLAGAAPEEWMPLQGEDFYREQEIDLVTGARVARLDLAAQQVTTLGGDAYRYDRLLLATGADPVRLGLPTHALPHVHYLRTLADARAVMRAAESARETVVIGASFIGLETAAALRARGLRVRVVAPHRHPLEHALGPELGDFVRAEHERQGVSFHLGDEVARIEAREVVLRGGARLPADLVVVGIGVRPGVGLASWAKLKLERGALAVDGHLQTSAPGVYGAGDLVSWPDPRSGELIRSEHWVVAMRQGQTAARNMLGAGERFDAVPFFWSAHYGVTIRYVGHAERWDRIDRAGDPREGTALFAYRGAVDGSERTLAVAAVGRDRDALLAESALEAGDWDALESMVPSRGALARG